MVSKSEKPILMVSSAVYGFEELLNSIYATLSAPDQSGEPKYEVWMSHKGTMPVDPNVTALESCRRAVKACDLFLGIILPRYGSGKERLEDDSIVHEELRMAISEKKPRWILAHDHVVFARSFLGNLCEKSKLNRKNLEIKRSSVFEDLRILDMYDLATRHDVEVYRNRKGNWVQKFGSTDEANLYAVSQFRRYQEAEAFVSETFSNVKAIERSVGRKGRRP